MRDAKLDLQALRDSGSAARQRVQDLPSWKCEAVQRISFAAASEESRQTLALLEVTKRKA